MFRTLWTALLFLPAIGLRPFPEERLLLDRAARESLKRSTYAYSSMAADFTQVVGADRLVATSARLLITSRGPGTGRGAPSASRLAPRSGSAPAVGGSGMRTSRAEPTSRSTPIATRC